MKYKTKENYSKRGNCLLKIIYYKLRAEKQFAHYIIGQGIESYKAGGAKEFINQTLMILGGALHLGNHEAEAEDCDQSGLVQ